MIELIKKLKPQVVVTGMAQFEAVTSSSFDHLLRTTREIGSRLFLDISDQFELSSLPSSNGVLKYLAGAPLPPHAAIICGLLKNKRYIEKSEMIGFSSSAISVLRHVELSISEADQSSLIHMDVEQSFLPIPTPVKAAIFESFARQNVTEAEIDVTPSISQFIKSNYGFITNRDTEFMYADYPLALFNKLVLCCIQEGGTLCFPSGSNGNNVSAAKFLNAHVLHIPTTSEVGFKLTEKQLNSVLGTVSKPWLYISGPTINPTGLLYSNEEIENILSICAIYGARVIIDTSFSGPEFTSKVQGSWDLGASLAKLTSAKPSFCVCLLGGLFFKMLTGGLTFGFLVLNQPFLVDVFNSLSGISKPHSTTKYTAKKLLDLREQKAGDLLGAVAEHGKLLGSRSKRLRETLEKCGWEVVEACAGISMVAKPSAYIGKSIKLKNDDSVWEAKLDDSNIREAMHRTTGLCINGASWTGIPGYCRFTIALEESDFDRALDCIVKFNKLISK